MTWQDEQKQVSTGVTDGTDGRKYSKVFPYEPKPRPVRVDDDDDIQDYKRPWVGLNWDDLPDIYVGDVSFLHGAKWAEAKLKEKNA